MPPPNSDALETYNQGRCYPGSKIRWLFLLSHGKNDGKTSGGDRILQTCLQWICKNSPSFSLPLQQMRKQAKEVPWPAVTRLLNFLNTVRFWLTVKIGNLINLHFTHQHVDSAAHTIFFVLIMHDGSIIQESFHQAHNEFYKSFSCFGEVFVFPAVFQEAEK